MAGSYDFEEQERIAELKAWWEDNGKLVLGALAVGLVAVVGWRGWLYWENRQAEDAALLFEPVSKAVRAKDAKALDEAAKVLIARHPGSFFASDAALLAAKSAFDAGRNAEAREKLQWVAKSGARDLQGVARLRLAAVLMDEKSYAEALKALDDVKDDAFVALAADLRGDVMLAQGRLDEARAAYKTAIDKAEPRNPVKNVAEVKLNALGGAK